MIKILFLFLGLFLFEKSQAQSGCFVQASCKQTISLPLDSASIFGVVTSTSAVTQTWKFVSGPLSAQIATPSASQTWVKKMDAAGTYIFSLTATNATGSQIALDTVVVQPAPPKRIVSVQTFYSDGTSVINQ